MTSNVPHRTVVSSPLAPSFSVITDAHERTYFWNRLTKLWGVPASLLRRDTFPCCNPCSISSKFMDVLASHTYDICLKSDGVRYLLFMTTREGNDESPVSLMIDRARNMYEVEVVAPHEYFTNGTIVEGELVWRQPDQRTMIFYVFDGLLIKGEKLAHLPFSERLSRTACAVRLSCDIQDVDDVETQALDTDSIVMVHFKPRIEMRAKHFVSMKHAARLWSERGDVEHRVDGLIFQDVNAPYRCGTATDHSCLKWKEHCTIDLRGSPTALRAVDGDLPATMEGRTVRVLPSRIVGTDASIIEYLLVVSETEIGIMAVRTRPDKSHGNSLRVIQATVNDVIHSLTPEDVASVCGVDSMEQQ